MRSRTRSGDSAVLCYRARTSWIKSWSLAHVRTEDVVYIYITYKELVFLVVKPQLVLVFSLYALLYIIWYCLREETNHKLSYETCNGDGEDMGQTYNIKILKAFQSTAHSPVCWPVALTFIVYVTVNQPRWLLSRLEIEAEAEADASSSKFAPLISTYDFLLNV